MVRRCCRERSTGPQADVKETTRGRGDTTIVFEGNTHEEKRREDTSSSHRWSEGWRIHLFVGLH